MSGKVYSTKSDVWSFGVVLWEMFSYGRVPYPKMTHQEVIDRVRTGYRMDPPEDMPATVAEVMQRCWRSDPAKRPSFKVLHDMLQSNASASPGQSSSGEPTAPSSAASASSAPSSAAAAPPPPAARRPTQPSGSSGGSGGGGGGGGGGAGGPPPLPGMRGARV
jgi:serine/threonine protein kinase